MNVTEVRQAIIIIAETCGVSYSEIIDLEPEEYLAAHEKLSLTFGVSFRHLYQKLEAEEDEVVFEGLISVFMDSGYENYGYIKQKIAGDILFRRKPKPTKSLQEILDLTLKSYNLSIDKFPWYLKSVFGEKALKDELNRRMKWRLIKLNFSKTEKISIQTFLFWLRDIYTQKYGADFDKTKAQLIVKGKSTKQDIAQLMGEPYNQMLDINDAEKWIYLSRVTTIVKKEDGFGKFAIEGAVEENKLEIVFDQDIVKNFVVSECTRPYPISKANSDFTRHF